MKMTDEQVENMEYFDETYTVNDDAVNQKRKLKDMKRTCCNLLNRRSAQAKHH